MPGGTPFVPETMVVVTLNNPREKFWGMLIALAPEGLTVTGLELSTVEDSAALVKEGETLSPAVVFFPMHRVEKMEVDLPDGNLPSLSQRFAAKTGVEPSLLLKSAHAQRRHFDPRRGRRG